MMGTRAIRLAGAAVAASVAIGPASGGGERRGRFAVVASVNNAGYIDVCGCKRKVVRQGSLSRRATLVRELRAGSVPFLLLDGGSALFSLQHNPKPFERPQWLAKARIIIDAYNAMGYDALNVGNADLKLGLETLKELEERARFPFLSANFLDPEGKPVFRPYIVKAVAGVRVGIIGLIINTLNPHFIERVAPGCRVRDAIETAREIAAEIEDDVDVLIALSHCREETNRKLAREVPRIDFIVDPNITLGSHGVWITQAERCHERVGRTAIVRTDGEGARLCRLDLAVPRPGAPFETKDELLRLEKGIFIDPIPEDLAGAVGGKGNAYAVTRVSVEPHYLPDPTIQAWIDAWKKEPGAAPERLPESAEKVAYLGAKACQDCHEAQYEAWLRSPHAGAFQALVDRGDHRRMDCIACHTLGFGRAFIDVNEAPKWANVQCESCHGTNPEHAEAPEKHRWGPVTRPRCLVCHNEEQTRTKFPASAFFRMRCPRSTH